MPKGPYRKFNVARKRKLVEKGAGGLEAIKFILFLWSVSF